MHVCLCLPNHNHYDPLFLGPTADESLHVSDLLHWSSSFRNLDAHPPLLRASFLPPPAAFWNSLFSDIGLFHAAATGAGGACSYDHLRDQALWLFS